MGDRGSDMENRASPDQVVKPDQVVRNQGIGEWVPAADLVPWDRNPKAHPVENVAGIARSIKRFGFAAPIVAWRSRQQIVAGHGRLLAAQLLYREDPGQLLATDQPGPGLVPVRFMEFANDGEAAALAIADNRFTEANPMDDGVIADLLRELQEGGTSIEGLGYDDDALNALLEAPFAPPESRDGPQSEGNKPKSLAERFGVPPFSVLDARQGYWQDRKRAWLAYGIRSHEGREENLMGSRDVADGSKTGFATIAPTTSIFDPVLCEIGYRWFAPKGGTVLDPFAGGSVRGVVAAACGLQYIGVDLRQEQVEANRQQWQELEHNWPDAPTPVWHCSDSRLIPQVCGDVQADLIYSCPPYADLEVYSDNPQDLSTLDYPAFVKAYREIIAAACGRMKQDRFAMFIVGDVRDKRGFYQNFPGDTISAFQDAGCTLYNEAVLLTQAGTVAMTAGIPFGRFRKLGKTHQNVLIFFKGNPKNIPDVLGECDFAEPENPDATTDS